MCCLGGAQQRCFSAVVNPVQRRPIPDTRFSRSRELLKWWNDVFTVGVWRGVGGKASSSSSYLSLASARAPTGVHAQQLAPSVCEYNPRNNAAIRLKNAS